MNGSAPALRNHKSSRRWGKSIAFGALVILACVLIAGVALFVWSRFETPDRIASRIQNFAPYFAIWRLALITMVIAFWRPLCERIARWRDLADYELHTLLAHRWTVAVALLLTELIAVQRLPLVLTARLGGE